MAEGKAVPKIAVGPQGVADWACDAVRAGGGEVVDVSEAQGLVWTDFDTTEQLIATLASNPKITWVQVPFSGVETYLPYIDGTRTWTSADVAAFAELTHDSNPLHSNEDFTATARFGRPVVHGMLYASMFGAIVGVRFPGAVYLSQTLEFKKPVFLGESVTATLVLRRSSRASPRLHKSTHPSRPSPSDPQSPLATASMQGGRGRARARLRDVRVESGRVLRNGRGRAAGRGEGAPAERRTAPRASSRAGRAGGRGRLIIYIQ